MPEKYTDLEPYNGWRIAVSSSGFFNAWDPELPKEDGRATSSARSYSEIIDYIDESHKKKVKSRKLSLQVVDVANNVGSTITGLNMHTGDFTGVENSYNRQTYLVAHPKVIKLNAKRLDLIAQASKLSRLISECEVNRPSKVKSPDQYLAGLDQLETNYRTALAAAENLPEEA